MMKVYKDPGRFPSPGKGDIKHTVFHRRDFQTNPQVSQFFIGV